MKERELFYVKKNFLTFFNKVMIKGGKEMMKRHLGCLIWVVLVSLCAAVTAGNRQLYSQTVIATVSVGSNPVAVGVNPTTDRVYVANNVSYNVSVIDGSTNQVIATVPVGTRPLGVDVNPTTDRVYVTNTVSNNVSVIDGSTNQVIATVPVGIHPTGVGVNPTTGRVYVANYNGNNVSVIDGSTNQVIATVPVGTEPWGVGVNPTTGRVYVTNSTSNNVSVIDGSTNQVIATVAVGTEPIEVGVNPTTGRVYVANLSSNYVSVIDGSTNQVIATVTVGTTPWGVGVNPTTGRVYVGNAYSNNVSVIDGSTNRVIATVTVGTDTREVGVNPTTGRVYVANIGSSTVSVIDDTPLNSAPVANAGADQSAYVGNTVTLDGSGSTDADGDSLTYSWSFTNKPSGSTAILSDTTSVNPTFTVDKAGTYVVSLTVSDGSLSSTDTVMISTLNVAPAANAGTDQSVYVGNTVTLDGSGSTDADGDSLTYSWSFTNTPSGSTATLSDTTLVNPTFAVDKAGTYVVSLTVSDGSLSSTDTVMISTLNVAPVADAGVDQTITVIGTTMQLDGTQSYDPDGDDITYQWTFTSKPDGSNASIESANTATPTFEADVHGDYVVQLVVNDASMPSSYDTVTISFTNIKPVADAGTSQSVNIGDTVTLDGSGSTDGNGDSLVYTWTLSSLPDGSLSEIANPSATVATFVPDKSGTYVVQLIVNDGTVDSDPSTVQVQVVNTQTAAIQAVQDCEAAITSLESSVFKNANMQNTLINKLNAVIANIEAGNYADALGQLQNDILKKTDGCVTEGAPDKNDWIKNCDAQGSVYPCILHSIEMVEALM